MTQTLTPFQRNAKGEKLDLNNPVDVELTIRRNDTLHKAVTNGIQVWDIKFTAVLTVSFQCYKCGYDVDITHSCTPGDEYFEADYSHVFVNCQCRYCKTRYSYSCGDDTITAHLPKKNPKHIVQKNKS